MKNETKKEATEGRGTSALTRLLCPNCTEGKLLPAIPNPNLEVEDLPDCPDCGGTGEIEIDPKWEKIGEGLKAARLKHKWGLRKFCMKFDLDPSEISRIERGLTEPTKAARFAYAAVSTTNA